MKILYIITSTDLGGAEKALADLAVETSKDHQIKILCLKKLGSVGEELKKQGIEVSSLEMKWFSQRQITKKIAEVIDNFQPDLVHAMLYRAIEYTRIAIAGKGIKLLTTPHFDLSKKNIFLRQMDRMLKDLDTLTVAESFSTAKYLIEKQKYNKNKVFLLPNGVDKNVFFKDKSVRENMRKKYGYCAENIVFISVARLEPVKDPLTLLQSFRNVYRLCPQTRLVYVGEGKERKKIEEYVKQSNLQKAVFLAGKQKNINEWLNMADIFMLTSIEESLPLSLLEALQVGLPCIVSNVGDMSLWVENGKNGFVCKQGDITLFSCFMNELILDPSKREKMADYSLEVAQRVTHTSQQYQQIYQQIFNNSFHVKTK